MPWCPKCNVEYREGFDICADCSTPLVDKPPPVPEKRVHQPCMNRTEPARIPFDPRPLGGLRQMCEVSVLGLVLWFPSMEASAKVSEIYLLFSSPPAMFWKPFWLIMSIAVPVSLPALCGYAYGLSRGRRPDAVGVVLGWLLAIPVAPAIFSVVPSRDRPDYGVSWLVVAFVCGLVSVLSGATLFGFRTRERRERQGQPVDQQQREPGT